MSRAWLASLTLGAVALSCGGPPRARDRPLERSSDPSGAAAPAMWVVDPQDPGPSLPPAGRSLFDSLVVREASGRRFYDVPFPFAALVARIAERVEPPRGEPPLKLVLVPRGRSLQRDAARPAFFQFPRAILAVDGQPRITPRSSGLLLKDRLYLGYQERADLIEVISYNEAAGRFEFQVVRDYREGATPRVVYANRALCRACHQNAGPIFARPLWDETNANPGIAGLLAAERRAFYGFPLEPGVDVPYLIDNATDRANLFPAWQLLWREGCGGREEEAVRCRAALLTSVLQYRLSGSRRFDARDRAFREAFLPTLSRRARQLWPGGWRVPSADLPNRNPLLDVHALPTITAVAASTAAGAEVNAQLTDLVGHSDVPASFEPLLLRGPLAIWPSPGTDEAGLERAVAGLGDFLADVDVRRLDEQLLRLGPPAGAQPAPYASHCTFDRSPAVTGLRRTSFSCRAPEPRPSGGEGVFALEGRVYTEGVVVRRGSVDSVEVNGLGEMPELEVTGGSFRESGGSLILDLGLRQSVAGLQARRSSGERVVRLTLEARGSEGRGQLDVIDDFARIRAAVDTLVRRTLSGEDDALGPQPFRRVAVLRALGAALGGLSLEWCCESAEGMPEAELDRHPPDGARGDLVGSSPRQLAFLRYCGRCHDTAEPFPPNFLHGGPAEVEAKLTQCAERIYFRLGMWSHDGASRPKTPMPPENALPLFAVSAAEWPAHPDLQALRADAASLLKPQGEPALLQTLEARGYSSLRTCLADPAPRPIETSSPASRSARE